MNPTPRIKKQQLTFPILPHNDLIACLNATGFPITEHDLQKPSKDSMMRFFVEFASQIMEMDYGLVGQYDTQESGYIMQNLYDTCDFPQLHKDSLPAMWFFKQLKHLIEDVIGIGEFSFKDLYKPEPARVKIILSGIVNFLRYREDSLGLYEEFNLRSEEYLNQKNAAIEKNQSLKDKIEQLKKKQSDQKRQALQIEKENNLMKQQIQSVKSDGDAIALECNQLKSKRQHLQELVKDASNQIDSEVKECEKLESLIISDPEKLKQNLVKKRTQLEQLLNSSQEDQQKLEFINQKLSKVSQIEQELIQCLEILVDCTSDQNEVDKLQESLVSLKNNLKKMNQDQSQYDQKVKFLLSEEKQQMEKVQRLKDSFNLKMNSVKQRLEQANSEWKQFLQSKTNGNSQSNEYHRLISDTKLKMSTLKENHDSEVRSLSDLVNELKESIILYMNDIERLMNQQSQ